MTVLPELTTIPNVELMKVGHWPAMSGPLDVTPEMILQAVAATSCPCIHNPPLKLGHTDPRFNGEPSFGWIGDIRASTNADTLIGDYRGVPSWAAVAMPSMYPQRSIEGEFDFGCQLGHVHPFVITAVALLGSTPPAIGALESLNAKSLGELFGVAAASDVDNPNRFVIAQGGLVRMAAQQVTAQATTSDVISQFYAMPAIANNYWMWLEELFIDPTQVIACDDSDGTLWLYPYSIGDDGSVVFGESTQVKRTYVAASVAGRSLVKFASLAESRPQAAAVLAARKAFASSGEDSGDKNKEETTMDFTSEIRSRLGVADDADEATCLAALDEALTERAEPEAVAAGAANPPGTVVVDAAQWDAMRTQVAAGVQARAQQETERRGLLVSAAINDGRIAPAGRQQWLDYLAAGTPEIQASAEQALAGLAKGTVPLTTKGHSQGSTEALAGENTERAFVNGANLAFAARSAAAGLIDKTSSRHKRRAQTSWLRLTCRVCTNPVSTSPRRPARRLSASGSSRFRVIGTRPVTWSRWPPRRLARRRTASRPSRRPAVSRSPWRAATAGWSP
jgi:hypothetical protein